MENLSSWRLNPTSSSLASCWKHNRWSLSTMDPPTSLRSYHHTQHHHPMFSSLFSLQVPHRRQRRISRIQSQSRLGPTDPALYHDWFSQRRTHPNFIANFGPPSSGKMLNSRCLSCLTFCFPLLGFLCWFSLLFFASRPFCSCFLFFTCTYVHFT